MDRSDERSALAWVMSGTVGAVVAAGLGKFLLDRHRHRSVPEEQAEKPAAGPAATEAAATTESTTDSTSEAEAALDAVVTKDVPPSEAEAEAHPT